MIKGSMLKSKKYDLYVIVVATPETDTNIYRRTYEVKVVKTDGQLCEDFAVGENYRVNSDMIDKCYENAV
jgi:hypothetical protein